MRDEFMRVISSSLRLETGELGDVSFLVQFQEGVDHFLYPSMSFFLTLSQLFVRIILARCSLLLRF